MYQPRRASRSEFIPVRHLQYHVRIWGEPAPGRVPLVLVHGWMDVSASWQFVVDALAEDHYVIAPDLRGFGLTETPPTDDYAFPDYLADLDAVIDHYSPDAPVNLVGHSLGGNVVMFYAGARPARIRRLVNLEGFGMPATQPSDAPGRYAKWMDEVKAFHRGELALKSYDDVAGVARRLMKTNPRLSEDKAAWLAEHWSRPDSNGRWFILGDAAHKVVNAQLFRVDEMIELYKSVAVPTLAIEASDDSMQGWWKGRYTIDEYRERIAHVPDIRHATVDDAGHMLHHDQPQKAARLIEDFL